MIINFNYIWRIFWKTFNANNYIIILWYYLYLQSKIYSNATMFRRRIQGVFVGNSSTRLFLHGFVASLTAIILRGVTLFNIIYLLAQCKNVSRFCGRVFLKIILFKCLLFTMVRRYTAAMLWIAIGGMVVFRYEKRPRHKYSYTWKMREDRGTEI